VYQFCHTLGTLQLRHKASVYQFCHTLRTLPPQV
jgi:hypothetical protein